jgi:hypothetical protein
VSDSQVGGTGGSQMRYMSEARTSWIPLPRKGRNDGDLGSKGREELVSGHPYGKIRDDSCLVHRYWRDSSKRRPHK